MVNLCCRFIFLIYQSIQDRDIPMLLDNGKLNPTWLPMRDKRCYIRGYINATFDIMMFQVFYVQQRYKISNIYSSFACE